MFGFRLRVARHHQFPPVGQRKPLRVEHHRDAPLPAIGAFVAAVTILNSSEAVAMSVFVVRAFMQMRGRLIANTAILRRLAEIDKTLLEHDSALRTIWTKLQPLLAPPPDPPRAETGFHIKEDAVPYRTSRKRALTP